MDIVKMNVNGKTVEVSLGIEEDKIEVNDINDEDTLDLTNVVKNIEENK